MAETKICAVGDCGKPVAGRGWCRSHYDRWNRHGDPLAGGPPKRRPIRVCNVAVCGLPHHAYGYCVKHANRFRAYGDPLQGHDAPTPYWAMLQWLRDHVGFDGQDCLIRPFSDNVTVDGVHWRPARYMCFLAHGEPASSDLHAAHSCGNGHIGCVHPRHLRWATAVENEADKLLHGTRVMGEAVHTAKLTEADVRKVRALRGIVSQWDLARQFGVSQSSIWAVLARRTWKHVA